MFVNHLEIIKSFIDDNPDDFTELELWIVTSCKYSVTGNFYIERHLKDYSIFIDNNSVYGVIGSVLATYVGRID